ncbi:MAG: hypothetical protein ACOVMM_06785 [Chitinophagaceae bacterium]
MITKIYKILTYILLLPAALLCITVFFSLLMAFANPGALLITFVMACVVIYTVVSFNFLQKVIIQQKTVPNKLKDWLKVNAYVTTFFVFMMVTNIINIFMKPNLMNDLINQMIEQQKNNPNMLVNQAVFYKFVMATFVLFFIYSLLLLIHILCSFKLLKQYNNNFKDDI